MESPEEIAARFDERAPRYDESAMHRNLAAAVASAVSLDTVHDVLDVATGTGLVARALPSERDLAITGIDISDGMLAVARTAQPSARFIHADAATLPFEPASFDLITCVTALHLFPDAPAALAEWRRVLRPQGRIVLATFAIDAPVTGQRGGAHVGHGSSTLDRHAPFGTPDALSEFAAAAGLQLSGVQLWAHPPVGEPDDVCLIAELSLP